MSETNSKAIITVLGTDAVGIIAKVSGKCSEFGVNILDITQKVFAHQPEAQFHKALQ